MTHEEFAFARKMALERIDREIREGIAILEETKRTLEDLRLERQVTESVYESIKPYLIG